MAQCLKSTYLTIKFNLLGITMTDRNSLMDFPCDFQIKIIGPNNEQFIKEIIDIIKPLKDSILIYKQILENIKSYYEDIPNTHNMIFVEIIKLINKELGLK